MIAKLCLLVAMLTLTACGDGPQAPDDSQAEPPEPEPTVFDPLTSTLDRARGVQQTVDEQAAEQRRKIEEAER
jgi:hypothetical protein